MDGWSAPESRKIGRKGSRIGIIGGW